MRYLLPKEKACRDCEAADCRPHTTGLNGAGKAVYHYSLRPDMDHAARHGR